MNYEYTDTDGNGLTDYDLHKRFDDMLNECHEPAMIAGMEYQASRALREVDPIAYRCGFNDWVDAELQDGNLIEL